MEGIWRAYVQNGCASSQLDLVIVNDRFHIEFSGMLKDNLANCEFLGRFTERGTEAFLKGNNRKGACENMSAVSISPVDMNTVKVEFSGVMTDPFSVDLHGVITRMA